MEEPLLVRRMDKDMQPARCKLQAAARAGEDRLGDDAGDEQATDGRCSGGRGRW